MEAQGGTLFLDELGGLSPRGQAKLLRVLETGRVRRVGEGTSRPVDFRVVSTAHESLSEQVAAGSFRHDLMQRVAGVVIRLPSLSERMEDVPALATYFARRNGFEVEQEALSALASQQWPGNVRQLRWTIRRSALFAEEGVITTACVRAAVETGPRSLHQPGTVPAAADHSLQELRAVRLEYAGDRDHIASALGVGRSTLYRRLRAAGLRLQRFRRAEQAG